MNSHESEYTSVDIVVIDFSSIDGLTQEELRVQEASLPRIQQYTKDPGRFENNIHAVNYYGIYRAPGLPRGALKSNPNCINHHFRNVLLKSGNTINWYIIRPK